MSNMNLKDALNRALRTTKKYVDDQIIENKFSGDYNDLVNRPCYDDRNTVFAMESFEDSLEDILISIEIENWRGAIISKISDFVPDIESVKSGSVYISFDEMMPVDAGYYNTSDLEEAVINDNLYLYGYKRNDSTIYGALLIALDNINTNQIINDDGAGENASISKGIWFISSQEQYITNELIYGKNGELKQLDEKFIPDTIARVSDLDKAIEENGFSGDYNDLENRPCYFDTYVDCIFSAIGYQQGTYVMDEDGTLGRCYSLAEWGMKAEDPYDPYTIELNHTHLENAIYNYRHQGYHQISFDLSTINFDDYKVTDNCYIITSSPNGGSDMLVIAEEDVTIERHGAEVTFAKGVYVIYSVENILPQSITNIGELKQLDEKFIPDTIARMEDVNILIEENGFSGDYNDLENRPCFMTPGIDTELYIPMPMLIDENDLFYVPSLTDKNGKSIYSNSYYIAHRGPFDMEWFAEAKVKVDYSRIGYKVAEIEFNNGWDDLNWNRFNFDNYKYSDSAYILTVPDPDDDESVMPYAAFILEDTVFTGMLYDYDIGEIVEKSVTLPQGVYLIDLGENGTSGPMTNVGLKQLDEKFIPDTIVRTKDLEDVAYSGDYNDLENRPCYQDLKPDFTMPIVPSSGYYKVFTGEYTLLGDYYNVNNFGEVISRDVEDYKHAIYTYKLDGKTCTLDLSTINFEDYRVDQYRNRFKITTILEKWNIEVELLYITDMDLATTKENKNGETVGFTYSSGATVVSISDLIQPVSLTNIGTIKQLDEKFIPDTIARVSDLEQAIEENGFSGDYNDLENKPCYEYDDYIKYDFDGNTEGKATIGYLVHITDELFSITEDQLYNSLFEQMSSGEVESGIISSIGSKEDILSMFMIIDTQEGKAYVQPELFCIIPHDNFTCTYNENNITFTKKGLWFFKIDTDIYFKSLSVPVKKVKQLDEKFIPDTIARVENLPGTANSFDVVIPAADIKAAWDQSAKSGTVTVDNLPLKANSTYTIYYNHKWANFIDDEEGKVAVFEAFQDGVGFVEYLVGEYLEITVYENPDDPTKTNIEFYETYGSVNIIGASDYSVDLKFNVFTSVPIDQRCLPNDLVIDNSLTIGNRKTDDPEDTGWMSIAMSGSLASGDWCSVALGDDCESTAGCTATFGQKTKAKGTYSFAQGHSSTAEGSGSHAEGENTWAKGSYSHSEGGHTVSTGKYQHVEGRYNIEDTEYKYAHIVGNGDHINRSNAHTLDWNGNAWFQGNVSVDGTPANDKDLVTKKYVDDTVANTTPAIITEEDINNIIANIDN